MNRWLTLLNLAGVLAVALLCGLQWRANHAANLELNALERSRLELLGKLEEQDRTLRGCTADLDDFRGQVSSARDSLRQSEALSAAAGRTLDQLTRERDQLKRSVAEWAQALTAREERAQALNAQLQQLARERNEVVTQFNDLGSRYNQLNGRYKQVIDTLNERTRLLNELAGRFEQARAEVPAQAE
jgi:chromosome segregation ATPase